MPISLITVECLKALNEQRDALTIVDTRPMEEYLHGHIPGAVHIAWEEWCAKPPAGLNKELSEPGYWGRLMDADDISLTRRLSAHGFANEKTVVVYADGARSKGREGRIAWMLLYFGARDVRLLDGGYCAWVQNRGKVEQHKAAPPIITASSADFVIAKDESRRVLLNDLIQKMKSDPHLMLVDTRTHREFRGEDYRYMPRMGSLPQSRLLPYASIFEKNGRFISLEKIDAMLGACERAGRNIIAFCEVGVRACTVALLLEAYTDKVVPVYDGSMMEWSAHPELPVVTGTPPHE